MIDSAAIYSPSVLNIYDFFVLGFSNRFAWKCPARKILLFYDQNISSNHLDVGVGTGYYLDKCSFPSPDPNITFMDINPVCLHSAYKRIARYRPEIILHDIMLPFQGAPRQFDSISLNFVLHCLAGDMQAKAAALSNLAALLSPGGRLFGTTILNDITPNPLAGFLLSLYNSKGIFSNRRDSMNSLDRVLSGLFTLDRLERVGHVAFFVCKLKRS